MMTVGIPDDTGWHFDNLMSPPRLAELHEQLVAQVCHKLRTQQEKWLEGLLRFILPAHIWAGLSNEDAPMQRENWRTIAANWLMAHGFQLVTQIDKPGRLELWHHTSVLSVHDSFTFITWDTSVCGEK